MAILFTQFLANYNIENLPKNFVKIVTNYVQYPCFLHLLFCKLGHSSMCADDELGLCKVLCNLADTTNYDIRQWVFCSL